MNYQTKKIKTRNLGKKLKETTTMFYKKNKEMITLKDVQNLIHKFEHDAQNAGVEEGRYMIRALSKNKYTTIKSFDQDDLDVDGYIDYYVNKCADPSKYTKFFQLQVTMIR